MQSSSMIASSSLFHPLSTFKPRFHGRRSRRLLNTRATASRRAGGEGDEYYGYGGGWRVDEDMIVLRKRIQEMKRMERGHEAPSDWLDWEKRCYGSYDSVVCDAMGVLQRGLMNSRPSFALGIIALLGLSVPVSGALFFYHLLQFGKVVLAGITVS